MYTVENLEKRYVACVDSISESLICLHDLYDELQVELEKVENEIDKELINEDFQLIDDARANLWECKCHMDVVKQHINMALHDMTLYY